PRTRSCRSATILTAPAAAASSMSCRREARCATRKSCRLLTITAWSWCTPASGCSTIDRDFDTKTVKGDWPVAQQWKETAERNASQLQANAYPGRGIVIGLTPDGTRYTQVYWIMGRSEN